MVFSFWIIFLSERFANYLAAAIHSMINSNRFIVKEIVQNFKRISLGTEPNYGIFILIFINENVANSCPYRLSNVGFAEPVFERRRYENYFRFHEWYTAPCCVLLDKK